jgi:hypothetical protein
VGTNTEHMSYYEYTKTDLLTPKQRKQFNAIDEMSLDSDFVDRLWLLLDHDVTDTLDDDGTEMENFRGALAEFCFGWVMGEKLPEQSK